MTQVVLFYVFETCLYMCAWNTKFYVKYRSVVFIAYVHVIFGYIAS